MAVVRRPGTRNRRQEGALAGGKDGGGGERETFAGVAEAFGRVAMGLHILGGSADVGPEGAGNDDAGDAMAALLRAPIGGDDGVEPLFGDEWEDAFVEQLQAAERGVAADRVVEIADDAVFAADGLGAGVFRQPAGGEGI